jgi:hypothetical protein
VPTVSKQDLELAFEWVSSGSFENRAYVCLQSGRIYWAAEDQALEEEELPDDIDDASRYLAIPTRHDLDLGSRLTFQFAEQVVPEHYDQVRSIFRRKGAYGRFKALLEREGKLQQWYDYQDQRELEALTAWCEDHGLELET